MSERYTRAALLRSARPAPVRAVTCVLISLITGSLFGSVHVTEAAEPMLDPISHFHDEAPSNEWHLAVMFVPDGAHGYGQDETGAVYPVVQRSYTTSLSLRGRYSVSERAALTVNASTTVVHYEESPANYLGTGTKSESSTVNTWGAGLRYRLEPQHPLDPSVEVSVENPCCVVGRVGAQLIRDPIVVSGSIGIARARGRDESSVHLGWNVGFVANDRINLGFGFEHSLPLEKTEVPSATISLRTGYGFDASAENEIVLVSTLMLRGNDNPLLGIGLQWAIRSP